MAASRRALKRSLLLSTVVVLALLSITTSAQSSEQSSAPAASESSPAESASSSAAESRTPTSTSSTSKSSTSTTSTKSSTTSESTKESTTRTSSRSTSATVATTIDGVPVYPAPTVPPTEHAPFMNKSTAPDGTVFIAVGSILGAFGAAVLIWRTVVGWMLHRSVERAALAQAHANDKAANLSAPAAPFYNYTDRESSPIGSPAGAASGRGQRRTTRGPTPSGTPSQTNLFFSPTAPGAASTTGSMGGNRDSRFLPSGFYAATSASPHPTHGSAISMSNLRPPSRGLAGPSGVSPPDSPALGPRSSQLPRDFSTSSINLHQPPTGRAPSAFLDDLLDEQGLPPRPSTPGRSRYSGTHTPQSGRS